MEVMQQLVGVTMHEPGVSRLVAVDITTRRQVDTEGPSAPMLRQRRKLETASRIVLSNVARRIGGARH